MASKLDGAPGALIDAEDVAPGGDTVMAAWMFGDEKTVVTATGALVPKALLLASAFSMVVAALPASESNTLFTWARAAGLLDCAEPAMVDKADTTAVPSDPVALMGAAATAASTVSALDWLSGVSVTLGAALTAASTS